MQMNTDVIIIGGGPVGLAAAANLSTHGVRSVIVEKRSYLAAPNVKCNHVSARTMESFRRLGLADKIRQAGLPADYPHDIAFRTTMTGREIARIQIPARADRFTSTTGPDTSWATPEPPHRVNQKYIEPIMMEHVAAMECVDLLNNATYLDFSQDAAGVTARIQLADGEYVDIRGTFMIGADGGQSTVRKQIGAKLTGDPVLSHVQSTCIRAKGLYAQLQGKKAWGYYTFNPRRNGHIYAIDGEETFIVHNYLTEQEAAAGTVDRHWAIRSILGVDESFQYEVLSNEDWIARRLVADAFRKDRVFLSGDACHLWVPYAGYGMNAGIADALNLSWLLASHVKGWADYGILDAYEAERLPITGQVSKFAMAHLQKISRSDVPAEIEDDTPAGEMARQKLGAMAYELNVQQFAAAGLNFGYAYTGSPIISYDGCEAPGYTMGSYTPSTVPGCRAPHFWLQDGTSFYDRLGPAYTLVSRGVDVPVDCAFLAEANEAGVPISVLNATSVTLPAAYESRFTLVRQDQHVVWRGDNLPQDPRELLSVLCGGHAPAAVCTQERASMAGSDI